MTLTQPVKLSLPKSTMTLSFSSTVLQHLYVTGVHEHPNLRSHGFRWEVGLELSSDNTAVTVWPADLSPNATVVRSILLHLSLVDVCHALPEVPSDLLLSVNTLDLNQ